jgi:two-component system, chemotaxis family, CheB/CheR fusion protein
LKLHDKHRHQVPNNAIDIFFESLAVEKGKNAVGIILSGTGTDGTKGIEAIKKNGGLVIAQDPVTADFDGMPASAIQTGNVDLILPPELIAEEMIEYLKRWFTRYWVTSKTAPATILRCIKPRPSRAGLPSA